MADPVTMMMVASTVFSVAGQQSEGRAAQQAANFEAAQRDQAAGQTRASSQREAEDQRRQARLVNSKLQANAGGGGLDTGVVNMAADITGEGEYRALSALYEGEESARGLEMGADQARARGKAARKAANFKTVSTLFSAGSNTLYSNYGGNN